MIEKLEFNHLRMLSTLYEQGTVSAAAEALDLSQQAVSLQLKRVREILGDPLFVRTGHGMVPTAYGQLIQPHVRHLRHWSMRCRCRCRYRWRTSSAP